MSKSPKRRILKGKTGMLKKPATATSNEPKHDWFDCGMLKGVLSCRVCGVVKNEKNTDKPCKGPVRVGPRAKPVVNEPKEGKCFNCGSKCDGDHYCYGCKEYICDKCDTAIFGTPGHGHNKSIHLAEYCHECGKVVDRCCCKMD